MKKIFGLIVICFIIAIVSGCAVSANSPAFDGPQVIYSSRPVSITGDPAQPPSWNKGKGTYFSEGGIVTADTNLFAHPEGTCANLSKNGKVPILGENTVYYLLLNDGQYQPTEERSAIGYLSGEVKEKRNGFVLIEAHLRGETWDSTIYSKRWVQLCP